MPSSHDAHMNTATEFARRDLVDAYAGMATGITRPASIRWRLDDASRGRPVKPLGSFPEIADACVDSGGSYHFVTRPLQVMLAHLRRRCGKRSEVSLREALLRAEKEGGESQLEALSLGMSVNCPEQSALVAFIRETTEEIQADLLAVEIAEDVLCSLTTK